VHISHEEEQTNGEYKQTKRNNISRNKFILHSNTKEKKPIELEVVQITSVFMDYESQSKQ
jgi:hypothetical protein